MFLEVHILQNFAPSNLNRDDTGSPKDCEFGGYRRARISSQCLKRSIRTSFKNERLLDHMHLASRTKRLLDALEERLARGGKDAAQARAVSMAALKSMGLGFNKDGVRTEYLLFLGAAEIESMASLIEEHWEDFAAAVEDAGAEGDGAKTKSAKDAKRAARQVNPQLGKALLTALDGGKAADLALFGRMLADMPDRNVDAACQVAHALSTNRVTSEFDFYTAVDDRKPEDSAGADMIGTVEFNSACFYRYANINLAELEKNLQQDTDLARETVRAFLRAAVSAVPSGKQNSTAAQNPPSLVMLVVREYGLWSLANAFVQPAAPRGDRDLVTDSVEKLDRYWGKLTSMYGRSGIQGVWLGNLDDTPLTYLKDSQVSPADDDQGILGVLTARALAAAFPVESVQ